MHILHTPKIGFAWVILSRTQITYSTRMELGFYISGDKQYYTKKIKKLLQYASLSTLEKLK